MRLVNLLYYIKKVSVVFLLKLAQSWYVEYRTQSQLTPADLLKTFSPIMCFGFCCSIWQLLSDIAKQCAFWIHKTIPFFITFHFLTNSPCSLYKYYNLETEFFEKLSLEEQRIIEAIMLSNFITAKKY